MKKRFWSIFLALFLSLCFVVPAMAESQDMWAYVYKDTGKMGADGRAILERITSGITFVVRSVDSDVDETLTYYGKSTSLTNPVTTASFESATICNDRVAFRVDPTDTINDRYVNLIVVDTNGGFTKTIEDFDKYQHSIVIDEKPNVMHHGIAWFDHAASSTVTDTGINFLPKTFIQDVRVEVTTADSGITIDVGTADTAAGFRNDVSLTSPGFVADTGVITNGSSVDYTAVTTYGTLLYTAITGSDVAADEGGRSYLGHPVVTSGTDDDLYYTLSSSSVDTAHGFIHFWFTPMRIP
jgi:hypothetical protein